MGRPSSVVATGVEEVEIGQIAEMIDDQAKLLCDSCDNPGVPSVAQEMHPGQNKSYSMTVGGQVHKEYKNKGSAEPVSGMACAEECRNKGSVEPISRMARVETISGNMRDACGKDDAKAAHTAYRGRNSGGETIPQAAQNRFAVLRGLLTEGDILEERVGGYSGA